MKLILNYNLIKEKYVTDLRKNFIPFWENAIDKTHGGVFTCFNNKGDEQISNIKYIWSQGRFLWLSCKLLKENNLNKELSARWETATDQTYKFLRDHAVMSNNHVVYAVKRDGSKISDQMDISIFADCFYVLGCNAYAQYKNDVNAFEHALDIYKSINDRIKENKFKSDPYPIPESFRSHSIPMILLNIAQEMYETSVLLNHVAENGLLANVQEKLKEIMTTFRKHNRIVEMLPNKKEDKNTLLARHVNPGHTLECIWFMLHSLKYLEEIEAEYYIENLSVLATRTLEMGWDNQYGGIFRFVDKERGEPKGRKLDTKLEKLIINTWDLKLWWPHSEALYTTLLLHKMTKDDKWEYWYEKLEKYIFQTFPNEDKEIGEWIQIRDRKGNPSEKVVALPVKDPFHIIRSYLLIIKLFDDN